MPPFFTINQILQGSKSTYTIAKQLHRGIDEAAVYLAHDAANRPHIIKSVRNHWRLHNERDILKRYQAKTPYLRPLIDEVVTPCDPPCIVLKYLDSEMRSESKKQRLSRPEIKRVARCVLEALLVFHKDGMVHTDVKLDNLFFNYGKDGQRFGDIQLGDCGGVVSQDSEFARNGCHIGVPCTRSPEALLDLPWDTKTDIWSFGNMVCSPTAKLSSSSPHIYGSKYAEPLPPTSQLVFSQQPTLLQNKRRNAAHRFEVLNPYFEPQISSLISVVVSTTIDNRTQIRLVWLG